jgi:hypothetical protein
MPLNMMMVNAEQTFEKIFIRCVILEELVFYREEVLKITWKSSLKNRALK